MLLQIQKHDLFAFCGDKTFLDPACGDGQFLVWVMVMKLTSGNLSLMHSDTFAQCDISQEYHRHLRTLYGVDIQQDNVDKTKSMLCMDAGHLIILGKNIRCKNALEYDFDFE